MSRKKLSQTEFEELAFFSKLFEDVVRDEVRKIDSEINIRGIKESAEQINKAVNLPKEKTMPEVKLGEPTSDYGECEQSLDGKHYIIKAKLGEVECENGKTGAVRTTKVFADFCIKCDKWGKTYE